jgi:hypothetical protein
VLGNSFVGPTSCSRYGGPFCTYPWYAWNGRLKAFTYGGDYPGTVNDFGEADQFEQTEDCANDPSLTTGDRTAASRPP